MLSAEYTGGDVRGQREDSRLWRRSCRAADQPMAVSCSRLAFPARSVPLSFFDEGDEPRTRTVRTPRARRPAAASGSPADAPDHQQLLVRRAIGLGGGVLVLILLVVGVKACASSAKKNSLRDYNTDVASIARDSDTQVTGPFFKLLESPNKGSAVNVEAQINQFRASAEDLAKRSRALSPPDEMRDAHIALQMGLDLRAGALDKISEKIRAALGTGSGAETAVNQIAGQMQAFLSSDVIWSQPVAPLIKEGLDGSDITGQTTPISRSLPNLGWLAPATVADRLRAEGAAGTTVAVAPGAHGHGLVSVAVGPTTLQPGSVNRIPATTPPAFTVKFQNQGDNDEHNVKASVRIAGAGRPITASKTVPQTTAGQTATVSVPLTRRPPVGTPVTITVAVAPVRGEKKTDNNRQEYPALFTR